MPVLKPNNLVPKSIYYFSLCINRPIYIKLSKTEDDNVYRVLAIILNVIKLIYIKKYKR